LIVYDKESATTVIVKACYNTLTHKLTCHISCACCLNSFINIGLYMNRCPCILKRTTLTMTYMTIAYNNH